MQALTKLADLKRAAVARGILPIYVHVSPEGWPELGQYAENMQVVIDDELPYGQAVVAAWNMRRTKERAVRPEFVRE